jgi:hypothetical protein
VTPPCITEEEAELPFVMPKGGKGKGEPRSTNGCTKGEPWLWKGAPSGEKTAADISSKEFLSSKLHPYVCRKLSILLTFAFFWLCLEIHPVDRVAIR